MGVKALVTTYQYNAVTSTHAAVSIDGPVAIAEPTEPAAITAPVILNARTARTIV